MVVAGADPHPLQVDPHATTHTVIETLLLAVAGVGGEVGRVAFQFALASPSGMVISNGTVL